MGVWHSILVTEEAPGIKVRLSVPLEYVVTAGVPIKVPAGFETDYASVPRILWPILPPHGEVRKAAVIHDYLYTRPECPRVIADAVFLCAMRDCGVARWRRGLMYLAVRCFGWMFRKAG